MRNGWLSYFRYFLEKKQKEYTGRSFAPYPHYLEPLFGGAGCRVAAGEEVLASVPGAMGAISDWISGLDEIPISVSYSTYQEQKRELILRHFGELPNGQVCKTSASTTCAMISVPGSCKLVSRCMLWRSLPDMKTFPQPSVMHT